MNDTPSSLRRVVDWMKLLIEILIKEKKNETSTLSFSCFFFNTLDERKIIILTQRWKKRMKIINKWQTYQYRHRCCYVSDCMDIFLGPPIRSPFPLTFFHLHRLYALHRCDKVAYKNLCHKSWSGYPVIERTLVYSFGNPCLASLSAHIVRGGHRMNAIRCVPFDFLTNLINWRYRRSSYIFKKKIRNKFFFRFSLCLKIPSANQ